MQYPKVKTSPRNGYAYRSVLLLMFMFAVIAPLVAQNTNPSNLSSSPYTRYGFGRLGAVGNGSTRAMGDVGIAVRGGHYTNLYNPASLTAIDTLTMLFDFGLEGSFVSRDEQGETERTCDAGFSYMSFHFPLWGGWAAALSLSPYSMIGYEYGYEVKEPTPHQLINNDTISYSNSYAGNGGLQNAMVSLAWRPWRTKQNQLNLGANIGYLWGHVTHGGSIIITSGQGYSTYVTRSYTAHGLDARFGAQWSHLISAKRQMTLGLTFSPKTLLDVKADYRSYSGTDTLAYNLEHHLRTPIEAGIGFALDCNRRLTVSGEYQLSRWGDVEALGPDLQRSTSLHKDVHRAAAGMEYRPQLFAQSYFKTCWYRCGLSWKSQYIETYGSHNDEYSISAGIGMPVNKRSVFNFTIDYTRVQPSQNGLLSENYLRLTLGMTFNEIMFFRSRLN